MQQRHHVAINLGKVSEHRHRQLRQTLCALTRFDHYIPIGCSMCGNECSESSIGNANPKCNWTTIGQKRKCIICNAVQALCQRIIATHISRWSACSQQNHTGRAYFHERNKLAYCSHYRLKHQSVALFVVGSNVQLGTHGLRLASAHAYLHTLTSGIRSARHHALCMQHGYRIKPLLACIQLALCSNCLPVGARNNSNSSCDLLIHC